MKFLRKYYKLSLIIIIPLLMGSYVGGCNILNIIYYRLCFLSVDKAVFEFNDKIIYQSAIFFEHIFVSDGGTIWHSESAHEICPVNFYLDSIVPPIINNLNRIEIFLNSSSKIGIVVGDNGTILRAGLGGSNIWNLISSPTTNNLYGLCESAGTPTAPGPIFAVGDAGTVIRSNDWGESWVLLNFPFTADLNDCSSPAPGEVICVGPSFTAYRTTDDGDTWKQIFFGDVLPASIKSEPGGGMQRIYYFDNNISYMVGNGGIVFRSNNNWNSYEFQDPGTSENLNDVFFVSPDSGVIIGENGIARFTSDGGQNWFEDPDVTTALNGTTLKRIKKQADDDFGYIVGGGGLSIAFARDSTAFITSVDEDQKVVTEYSLSQNYPNPFNPSTKINYSIPQFGLVTLKVYDLLGNEIATLVNEEKNAGNYLVDFSGDDLPSGIYFCKITAGNYSETKKLVLLK